MNPPPSRLSGAMIGICALERKVVDFTSSWVAGDKHRRSGDVEKSEFRYEYAISDARNWFKASYFVHLNSKEHLLRLLFHSAQIGQDSLLGGSV